MKYCLIVFNYCDELNIRGEGALVWDVFWFFIPGKMQNFNLQILSQNLLFYRQIFQNDQKKERKVLERLENSCKIIKSMLRYVDSIGKPRENYSRALA